MAKKTHNSATASLKGLVSSIGKTIGKHKRMHLLIFAVISWMLFLAKFFGSLLQNSAYLEVFPKELVFPVVMHGVSAGIIAFLIYLQPWVKTFSARAIAVVLLSASFIGYDANLMSFSGIIRAFVPGLTDQEPVALVSAMYVLVLIALSLILSRLFEKGLKRFKRVTPRDASLGVFALVAYVFLLPTISIVTKLPNIVSQSTMQPSAFNSNGGVDQNSSKESPDIYYIVLDRYTNADVLHDQFNYDNSSFTDYLRQNKFTVKDDAYSNYPFTNMSVSSTINGQYTKEYVEQYSGSSTQSSTLYYNLIWQNAVAKTLKAKAIRITVSEIGMEQATNIHRQTSTLRGNTN